MTGVCCEWLKPISPSNNARWLDGLLVFMPSLASCVRHKILTDLLSLGVSGQGSPHRAHPLSLVKLGQLLFQMGLPCAGSALFLSGIHP